MAEGRRATVDGGGPGPPWWGPPPGRAGGEGDATRGMTTEQVLDATGLKCPLPVLRARKALRSLPAGARLRVLATDPGALQDFKAFCEAAGHDLLESGRGEGGVLVFLIRKA